MLNGPALIRVFLVVVAAAVLTGLVQHYWIFDSSPPEAPKPVARATAQSQPVRRADPPAVKQAPQAIAPRPSPPTPESASPRAEPQPQLQAFAPARAPPETRNAALTPAPMQAAPEPPPARPQPQSPAPPPPPAAQAAVTEPAEESAAQEDIADARAVDLVDLNTGTLAELNGLKGGGAIGRAIIQRRPYASTDQLLSKRVLSRAIYQRIRDQVTVR